MSKAFLRKGSVLTIQGDTFEVDRQCKDGVWVLTNQKTGRTLDLTTTEILDEYARGKIVFKPKDVVGIKKAEPRKAIALEVSDAKLKRAKVRLAYVTAIRDLPFTRQAIEAAIDEVWRSLENRPATPPHWVTVYRWSRAYQGSDANAMALTDATEGRGNRQARYSDEVLAVCESVIEEFYLTLERPGIAHVTNLAKAKVRQLNSERPAGSQLAAPSRALVERLVSDLPAYDVYVARHGREAARKKFRAALHQRLVDAPLQRAEMDHTRLNVLVVDDENGLPLGRPWLSILLDEGSRMALGNCISFEPPSRATVARCLKHAFMPKTGLREEYPDIVNEWPAFGVPQELVLDGGPEFYSEQLERICFELGIEQHFSPRKTPWFKGKVERFQGTLNRGVTVTVPGKTFDGILERDDYDPTNTAVVTLSTLKLLVNKWIVDVYHQKTHSALGCSPQQAWLSRIQPHDIPLVADPLRFDAILGGAETRKLTHKGIEYAGLLYNSPEMLDLRQAYGDSLDVEIRFDRSNLGSVIVLHPERDTPYRVPCLRADYAEGLTEWQHKVCKRYAKEHLRGKGDVDTWLDALLAIEGIVQRELKVGKAKGAKRDRISRWNETKPEATKQGAVPTPQPVKAEKGTSAAASDYAMPVARKKFTPILVDRQTSDGPNA